MSEFVDVVELIPFDLFFGTPQKCHIFLLLLTFQWYQSNACNFHSSCFFFRGIDDLSMSSAEIFKKNLILPYRWSCILNETTGNQGKLDTFLRKNMFCPKNMIHVPLPFKLHSIDKLILELQKKLDRYRWLRWYFHEKRPQFIAYRVRDATFVNFFYRFKQFLLICWSD